MVDLRNRGALPGRRLPYHDEALPPPNERSVPISRTTLYRTVAGTTPGREFTDEVPTKEIQPGQSEVKPEPRLPLSAPPSRSAANRCVISTGGIRPSSTFSTICATNSGGTCGWARTSFWTSSGRGSGRHGHRLLSLPRAVEIIEGEPSCSQTGAASSRPSAERRAARSGSKSTQAGEYLEKLHDRHQPRNRTWRVRGLGPVDGKKLIRLDAERGGDPHDGAGPGLDLSLLDPDDLLVWGGRR